MHCELLSVCVTRKLVHVHSDIVGSLDSRDVISMLLVTTPQPCVVCRHAVYTCRECGSHTAWLPRGFGSRIASWFKTLYGRLSLHCNFFFFLKMPRLNVFQPFRRRDRSIQQEYPQDTRVARYDVYDPNAGTRSGSRWRNVLTKRDRHVSSGRPEIPFLKFVPQRGEVYVNDTDYGAQPPEIGRVAGPSRRATVEDYQESFTDSDSIPAGYPVQDSQPHFVQRAPSHSSFREPTVYEERVPSHASFHQEPMSSQPPSIAPQFVGPPNETFVAPPGDVYMEEPPVPLGHDNRSEYTQEPPVMQAEPRRFRPRRGEPITVGNMRIEVDDDGRRGRSHRSRRSRSRSTGTYSSRVSFRYISNRFLFPTHGIASLLEAIHPPRMKSNRL